MALTQAKETGETGEPDAVKVARPVRGGTGRKGSNDLARGLPYLVPRCGYRRRLTPSVRLLVNLACPEKLSCTVQGAIYNKSRLKHRVSSIFFRVYTQEQYHVCTILYRTLFFY